MIPVHFLLRRNTLFAKPLCKFCVLELFRKQSSHTASIEWLKLRNPLTEYDLHRPVYVIYIDSKQLQYLWWHCYMIWNVHCMLMPVLDLHYLLQYTVQELHVFILLVPFQVQSCSYTIVVSFTPILRSKLHVERSDSICHYVH